MGGQEALAALAAVGLLHRRPLSGVGVGVDTSFGGGARTRESEEYVSNVALTPVAVGAAEDEGGGEGKGSRPSRCTDTVLVVTDWSNAGAQLRHIDSKTMGSSGGNGNMAGAVAKYGIDPVMYVGPDSLALVAAMCTSEAERVATTTAATGTSASTSNTSEHYHRVLDLCCGCGVQGISLAVAATNALHLQLPKVLSLLYLCIPWQILDKMHFNGMTWKHFGVQLLSTLM